MRQRILLILSIVLAIYFTSCEDGIITEADRPPIDIIIDTTVVTRTPMANLTYIQDSVFTPTCATSGCHNGGGLAPDLRKGETMKLVGTKYIKPGDTDESLIIRRMKGRGGTVMPPPYSDFEPHPTPVIDSIEKWVRLGANPN
jgi:hypothetical protein